MIRVAQSGDLQKCIDLALSYHEASAYRQFPPDRHAMLTSLQQLHQQSTGIVLVAQHGRILTGLLAGFAQELWFSRYRYATDLVFISRGGDGAGMVKRFCDWAWSIPRVLEVTMGVSSGIHPERAGRLYELLGFENQGGMYTIRRPAPDAAQARG